MKQRDVRYFTDIVAEQSWKKTTKVLLPRVTQEIQVSAKVVILLLCDLINETCAPYAQRSHDFEEGNEREGEFFSYSGNIC